MTNLEIRKREMYLIDHLNNKEKYYFTFKINGHSIKKSLESIKTNHIIKMLINGNSVAPRTKILLLNELYYRYE